MCGKCGEPGAFHTNAGTGRLDPTKTTAISNRFERDMHGRLSRVAKAARDHIMGPAFVFGVSATYADDFSRWIHSKASEELEVIEGTPTLADTTKSWAGTYIHDAYNKSLMLAASKLRKGGATVEDSFLSRAFNRPIHADRVAIAYSRTYEELQGITQTMATQLRETIALGMAGGKGQAEIAREVMANVDRMSRTRARLLARTEVISAAADATLNIYNEAGVRGVEVEAEWLTAAGACPLCLELQAAGPYDLQIARGLLPAHPNCRCAWIPKVINGTGIVLR